MTATGVSTVALFAHRFDETAATGIGQSARELRTALGVELGAARQADLRIISCSAPEHPRHVAPGDGPVAHVTLPGPRKLRYAAWTAARWPSLERTPGLDGIDLLHVQHPAVMVPSRAPAVHTVHDILPVIESGWYRRSERWLHRRAYADLVEHSARVMCDSPYVADQVIDVLGVDPDRVTVVPIGVAGRFVPVPVADGAAVPNSAGGGGGTAARLGVEPGRYLLHVGTITRRKNLVPLVAAMAALPPAVVPTLVLAGPDGLGAAAVRAEVARLGLTERIRFAGYVADDALPALVAGAAALVHPSLGEGFGLTPLEAMAVGTPVIVSGAGSLPWVVGDAGMVVGEPTDGDAWAGAIAGLLADDDRGAAMVAAGRAQASRFTWAAAARATLDVYREVLAAGR